MPKHFFIRSKRPEILSIIFLCMILLVLAHAPNVFAADLENPLGTQDLRVVMGNVIKAILGFAGALALLMFIWGGVLWLTSGGSDTRIKKGKDTLTWATIGLVVILTAYTIVRAVIDALTRGSIN